jgi:murein DD-endopeptidase MepM/ murein hydrolase activator NlpD
MSISPQENAPAVDMDQIRASAESSLWEEESSKLTYSLPVPLTEEIAAKGLALAYDIPRDKLVKIGTIITLPSPESHIGPFRSAIDFAVEDGTPVLAAQDGKVFAIEDSNNRWGSTEDFANSLNYVTIQHSSGEFSEYAHLAQSSVSELGLKVGAAVKRGQQIGKVGKTGWTDRDHLHFLVFRLDQGTGELPNKSGFKSLVPLFKQ